MEQDYVGEIVLRHGRREAASKTYVTALISQIMSVCSPDCADALDLTKHLASETPASNVRGRLTIRP